MKIILKDKKTYIILRKSKKNACIKHCTTKHNPTGQKNDGWKVAAKLELKFQLMHKTVQTFGFQGFCSKFLLLDFSS